MKTIIKPLLIAAGTISLALGIIGIFVPLLPTTPFLLLTAFCYAKSSPRLLKKLISNRFVGKYINDYRLKKAIPLKIKAVAIGLLWLSISYSAFFVLTLIWLKILLIAIAATVTYHILKLRTLNKNE